jgi:predicted nucleic acid-binding protein
MIAIDTNVLIYACDQSDERRQQIALDLIAAATDGVLLWQVACEFVAASRKLAKNGFRDSSSGDHLGESRLPRRLVKPEKISLGLFQRVTNSQADKLQSLDAIDPVGVTKQRFPQSVDAVRTRPIPPVTNEDRRTNRDDDARMGLRVHQCASSGHGTNRNPALHDVLHLG